VQNISKLNNLKNTKKTAKNNSNFKISTYHFFLPQKTKPFLFISLFTRTDNQLTDEDTSDETDELLNEMSETLENLLRSTSREVKT
jgi:hypothetical protein